MFVCWHLLCQVSSIFHHNPKDTGLCPYFLCFIWYFTSCHMWVIWVIVYSSYLFQRVIHKAIFGLSQDFYKIPSFSSLSLLLPCFWPVLFHFNYCIGFSFALLLVFFFPCDLYLFCCHWSDLSKISLSKTYQEFKNFLPHTLQDKNPHSFL